MDYKYRYKNVTSSIANNTGLPCGEIENEWVSCKSFSEDIKCCSDIKSGYIDKNSGTTYFSKYGFSCDYDSRCSVKNY